MDGTLCRHVTCLLPPWRLSPILRVTWVALIYYTSATGLLRAQDPAEVPTVAPVQFSHARGFYQDPFILRLHTATADAQIHYTIQGSAPGNLFTSHLYDEEEGLPIDTTTILRVQARKPGHGPSPVATHTFLFPRDVVDQPDHPEGFSTAWTGADYGMDADPQHLPLIAGDDSLTVPEAKNRIADALLALPSLSLVMEHGDLFGPARGIYHHTQGRGSEWERPVSVEWLSPDSSDGFQIDAGIRMQGFTSRDPSRNPKHSMRLVFRRHYGAGKLRYPVFGWAAATEFDTLILRSNSQDAWVYDAPGNRVGQFVRDEWARETQRALGRPAPRGTWVHLYLNGLYWGVYNPTERPDASFTSSYLGGPKEAWDVLKNHEEVLDGTGQAYAQALSLIQNDPARFARGYRDLSDDAAFSAAAAMIDTGNLIDYLIPNMYAAATDWPGNNYIARRRDLPDARFLFFSWDNEHGMKHPVTENRTLPHSRDSDSPTKFHHALAAHDDYRLEFADRLHRAFFNDGPLQVEDRRPHWDPEHPDRNRPAARWMALTTRLEEALIAESARWGDYRRSQPYTVTGDFLPLREQLLRDWFPQRSAIVLDQFRDRGLYPKWHAPVFQTSQSTNGISLTMQSKSVSVFLPGARILYTLDGSDPRSPDGSVSPTARDYETPVTVNISLTVKARVEQEGQWSALNETPYLVGAVPPGAGRLRFSMIHYHPSEPSAAEREAGYEENADFEFLEIENPTTDVVSLRGLRVAGGVAFASDPEGQPDTLAPGGRARIVRHPEAYTARGQSGGAAQDPPVIGRFSGRLANEGETLVLLYREDPILEIHYDDEDGWPSEADGAGPALVLKKEGEHPLDARDPAAWTVGAPYGDTPGGNAGPWHDWLGRQSDPGQSFGTTGLSHLEAYYFAVDLRPLPEPRFQVKMDPQTASWEIVYSRRAAGLDGIDAVLQGSTDLRSWQPLALLEEDTFPSAIEGVDHVRVRLQTEASFVRWKLVAP